VLLFFLRVPKFGGLRGRVIVNFESMDTLVAVLWAILICIMVIIICGGFCFNNNQDCCCFDNNQDYQRNRHRYTKPIPTIIPLSRVWPCINKLLLKDTSRTTCQDRCTSPVGFLPLSALNEFTSFVDQHFKSLAFPTAITNIISTEYGIPAILDICQLDIQTFVYDNMWFRVADAQKENEQSSVQGSEHSSDSDHFRGIPLHYLTHSMAMTMDTQHLECAVLWPRFAHHPWMCLRIPVFSDNLFHVGYPFANLAIEHIAPLPDKDIRKHIASKNSLFLSSLPDNVTPSLIKYRQNHPSEHCSIQCSIFFHILRVHSDYKENNIANDHNDSDNNDNSDDSNCQNNLRSRERTRTPIISSSSSSSSSASIGEKNRIKIVDVVVGFLLHTHYLKN
jgi:hypothetical protein